MKKWLLMLVLCSGVTEAASLVVYSTSITGANFSVPVNYEGDCITAENSIREKLSGTYGLHYLCLSGHGDVVYDH